MQEKKATWIFSNVYFVGSNLQVFHILSLLQAEKIALPTETIPQEPIFESLFVFDCIFHK